MNIEERLKRMAERRGETPEARALEEAYAAETDEQWEARQKAGLPLVVPEANLDANSLFNSVPETTDSEDTPAKLAELLALDGEQAQRVLELLGGQENHPPFEREFSRLSLDIGMEGFNDGLIRLIDRVVAYIKKLIKEFTEAEFTLRVTTEFLAMKVEQVREEMRGAGAGAGIVQGTFIVGTRVPNLCVRYKPVKDATTLLNSLFVLQQVTKGYFDDFHNKVLTPAQALPLLISQDVQVETIAEQIVQSDPNIFLTGNTFREKEGRLESMHLLGNHKLVVTRDGAGTAYDRVRGVTVTLEPSSDSAEPLPAEIQFTHFNNHMAQSILTRVDSILAILNGTNTRNRMARRKAVLASLTSAMDSVRLDLQNVDSTRDEAKSRQLMALIETYISWIVDPYIGFYSYTVRNLRAAVNVCEANVR